ncbi:uncharacterized protein EV420DRAFT_1534891 [Desarmillaria tabescens]|uniref:Secreted protein n=1 Tax=Armillaria tabescens TaxID=1929756 RepID=A0AA39KF75_ARMTA|nr:uncharacterized protein EV420DRAFT_1534891 [Desarmillaria tabescens]KAK0460079.1 hypothetical protein EV420DRAFT_1534891 [Desarmillaria tabescens]
MLIMVLQTVTWILLGFEVGTTVGTLCRCHGLSCKCDVLFWSIGDNEMEGNKMGGTCVRLLEISRIPSTYTLKIKLVSSLRDTMETCCYVLSCINCSCCCWYTTLTPILLFELSELHVADS